MVSHESDKFDDYWEIRDELFGSDVDTGTPAEKRGATLSALGIDSETAREITGVIYSAIEMTGTQDGPGDIPQIVDTTLRCTSYDLDSHAKELVIEQLQDSLNEVEN